jgi:hypothetical protein
MRHDMPNAQFFAIAILILLSTAWILIRYARACRCDSCKESYAIFQRGELQLCRQCKIVYDRYHWRRPV